MAKSLAEQIAELTKPTTEFDIEDNDLRGAGSGSDSDADAASDSDGTQRRGHYVALTKSKLRRNDPALGAKYSGSKSSRSNIYADAASDASDAASDASDASDAASDASDAASDASDAASDASDAASDASDAASDASDAASDASDAASDANDAASDASDAEDTGSDDNLHIEQESVSDSDGDHDSQSEQSDSQSEPSDSAAGEDAARAKLKALLQQERQHIVGRLLQASSSDALKGYAVQQQHRLFDAVLDARINLQKAVAAANELPPTGRAARAAEAATKRTPKHVTHAAERCFDLLDRVLALRDTLAARDAVGGSSGAAAPPAAPRKRTLEEYVAATARHDAALARYRGAVLTKWLARIQTSSGASALNAGKFKAINQTAEQQVANNLSDMPRLVKRTRLNRRLVTPLGYTLPPPSAPEAPSDDDVPQAPATRANALAELPTIFDDEDFYRVLLSDLVDKKVQSADPTLGLAISLASAQRLQKLNKAVDTRASKGRKLRYHVQEPIANFEAPRDGWRWKDAQIDEFFASLLGQKVHMDEAEEEESADDEVAADGIKLFG